MNIKYLLATLAATIIVSKEYLLFNDNLVIISVFATVFYFIVSMSSTFVTQHINDVCIGLNNDYSAIFKNDEAAAKTLNTEIRNFINYLYTTDLYNHDICDKIIFA